jgi:chitodextrinase
VPINSGSYSIQGSNTYAEPGRYAGSIIADDANGSSASLSFTADVAAAPLDPGGPETIDAVQNRTFSGEVGTMVDTAGAYSNPSDLSATIYWGDGKDSAATLVPLGGGNYSVQGTNVYGSAGTFSGSIQVFDHAGSSSSSSLGMSFSASVSGASYAPLDPGSPEAIYSAEGQTFSGAVGLVFDEAGDNSNLANLSGTISWGNGDISNATLVPINGNSGSYSVQGTEVYTEAGSYSGSVQVTESGGESARLSFEAYVAAASLSAGSPESIDISLGQTYSGEVANFSDQAGAYSSPSNLSATINWGDGTTSPGQIVPLGGGSFAVCASYGDNHTYATEGSYYGTADVTEQGGNSLTGTYAPQFTAFVDAALQPGSAETISATQGHSFGGEVGSFVDAAGSASNPPSLSATVDFGDGRSPVYADIVPLGDGTYSVQASYTYASAGSYGGSVQVSEEGSSGVSLSFYAGVTSLPASPTGLAVAGVTDTTATLTWTAPPGSPPASYEILRDGEQVGSTAATAFQDTGLSPSQSYTYTVVANGAAGDASAASAAATATTTATLNDNTPPTAPVGVGSSDGDSKVSLSWVASTDNVGVVDYEVDQEATAGHPETAFMVGQTPATNIVIGGLDPSTSYTFLLKAYDAANNFSSPSAVVASTAADQTAPTAPTNFLVTGNTGSAISLSWSASSDNVGVTSYTVLRAATPYLWYFVPIATPEGASFTDSNVTPGLNYAYEVVANDAAGNSSDMATLSITAATPSSTDTAPNQYIPPEWQSYFYNNLTAALRQRDVMAGLTPPVAQGWLDKARADTVIVNGTVQSGGLPIANNIAYLDRNGNGQYDPGETAWVLSPLQTNEFDTTYQPGDTLLTATAPPTGTKGITGVYYQDLNNNGQYDPGEELLQNVNLIQGVQGQLAYRDINGVGYWQSGDPIWYDANGNGQYDTGETVIYHTSVLPQPGDLGKTNGLCYYNAANSSTWQPSDTLVWVDNTTFRQDFAAFYTGLDALIPKFGRTDSAGVYPNDLQSAGMILDSLGSPRVSLNDTISVASATAPGTSVVTRSGSDFSKDVLPDDNVLIGGNWYQVATASATTIYLAQPYIGPAVTNAPLTVNNWTLIPAESTVPNEPGLSFSYQRGQPTSASVVFAQQFTELQGALNALTQLPNRYDVALYDTSTSNAFIAAATSAINDYRAVFGTPAAPKVDLGTELANLLQARLADPGSVDRAANVQLLEQTTDAVTSRLYARDPGSSLSNGWLEPSTDSQALPVPFVAGYGSITPATQEYIPYEPQSWQVSGPAPFSYVEAGLLPQLDESPGASRTAGAWSTFAAQTPILPVHVSEVSDVLSAVDANGLWISMGRSTIVPPADPGQGEVALFETLTPPPAWPDAPSFIGWDPTASGAVLSANLVGLLGFYDYSNPMTGSANGTVTYNGTTITVDVPTSTNPNGGASATTMALGPDGLDVDGSSWQWGQPETLASISADQVKQLLLDHLAADPLSGLDTVAANGPTPLGDQFWWWTYSSQTLDPNGNIDSGTHFAAVFVNTPNPSLYGLVPPAPSDSNFSYQSTLTAPELSTAGPLPTSPLAPTTALDYLNAVPDTDADDIVNVSADPTSLGAGTGSIAFEADRDLPQAYIPLYTDTSGALPIHAYIVQGGFGSSQTDIGNLGSTAWTSPDISQSGVPYSYSLDTRVRQNMLVNTGANHIKRIEVIRPRGNAVVFDFAWDAAANQFSPIGTPDGYNGRDASRLYILRDLTPQNDTDFSYALQFPSGITQVFGGNQGGAGVHPVRPRFQRPEHERHRRALDQSSRRRPDAAADRHRGLPHDADHECLQPLQRHAQLGPGPLGRRHLHHQQHEQRDPGDLRSHAHLQRPQPRRPPGNCLGEQVRLRPRRQRQRPRLLLPTAQPHHHRQRRHRGRPHRHRRLRQRHHHHHPGRRHRRLLRRDMGLQRRPPRHQRHDGPHRAGRHHLVGHHQLHLRLRRPHHHQRFGHLGAGQQDHLPRRLLGLLYLHPRHRLARQRHHAVQKHWHVRADHQLHRRLRHRRRGRHHAARRAAAPGHDRRQRHRDRHPLQPVPQRHPQLRHAQRLGPGADPHAHGRRLGRRRAPIDHHDHRLRLLHRQVAHG